MPELGVERLSFAREPAKSVSPDGFSKERQKARLRTKSSAQQSFRSQNRVAVRLNRTETLGLHLPYGAKLRRRPAHTYLTARL